MACASTCSRTPTLILWISEQHHWMPLLITCLPSLPGVKMAEDSFTRVPIMLRGSLYPHKINNVTLVKSSRKSATWNAVVPLSETKARLSTTISPVRSVCRACRAASWPSQGLFLAACESGLMFHDGEIHLWNKRLVSALKSF